MTNLITNNAGDLFTSIWLDVEGGPQYWSKSTAANIKFLEQMFTAAKAYQPKYNLGIYTSASQWSPIVGSSYSGGKNFPLWYAAYNNIQNFNDFRPFAGWTAATLHQWKGDTTLCGVGLDLNIIPYGSLRDGSSKAVVNGGTAPPPVPIANSAACVKARGACQDTSVKACVGTVQHGLCTGSSSVVCCVAAPVLKSSAPVLKSSSPVAGARPVKKSTHGRVVAEAVDTGRVTWHEDRPRRANYRKMKMGGLMRIKHKKKHHRKHKKMVRVGSN